MSAEPAAPRRAPEQPGPGVGAAGPGRRARRAHGPGRHGLPSSGQLRRRGVSRAAAAARQAGGCQHIQ